MNGLLHPALLVGLGGACGSIGRYYIGRWLNLKAGHGIPWGTLLVNLLGTLGVVVFALVLLQRAKPELRSAYLLLGTGFCGGFTTFSAFELEVFELVREGNWHLALVYFLLTVVGGGLAVLLATTMVRWISGPPAP
jgi:CrcB protein